MIIESLREQNVWDGRVDDDQTSLRYHQVVRLQDINELKTNKNNACFGIIGFQCDEGVRRNKGRVGAAKAPNEIRNVLASIPYTLNHDVVDVGNVVCEGEALESAQQNLSKHVTTLLNKQHTPIILGGGHETFYGHYLGVREAVGEEASIGMINIDAHFDLRIDKTPSSGTMFQQILSEDSNASYLCLGIQKFGNTKALFSEAKKHRVEYILEEDITKYEKTFEIIDKFVKKHDYIIITLCTDSIISTAAPGVSAPSPFGLEPKVVKKLLRHLVAKKNALSFDISEVNPVLDRSGQTTRLAAYLLAEVMHHFHKRKKV
ncbi:MAG TPA: formimidoylglutamase [Candidatus Avamphibacillus sp.]|nr:formimidoylglutamase [Candidatus Avamphibacillus sp.]